MLSDTHPEIAERHREMWRRMTEEQRLRATLDLCNDMRAVALAGLRHRKPELNEEELRRELMRMLYGNVFPQ